MANLAPYVFWQNFDNNGNPLSGGKVYTYEAGTSTPKVTYTDSSESVANANPVTLDSAGRAAIWLGDGGYKFILKTSADVTVDTRDNIGGTNSTAFGAQVYDISANTLVVDTYANALLVCTGTITLTLPAVSGINEGFYFLVRNDGSGVITVDPDGSETINNVATLAIQAGESAVIICDGDEWSSLFNIPAFVATLTGTQALTNKTIGNTNTVTLKDTLFSLEDNADATKIFKVELAGQTTATTVTMTPPNGNFTAVGLTNTQALTNKDLTSGTNTFPVGMVPVSLGVLATTSGTEAAWTTVPSTANRLTLNFSGVSTNGVVLIKAQLGSGSYSTSGYLTNVMTALVGTMAVNNLTDGFNFRYGAASVAATAVTGTLELYRVGTTNEWIGSLTGQADSGTQMFFVTGKITLGGALDRLRIYAGGDTFDAGTAELKWSL